MNMEKQRIAIAEACPEIAEIDKDNGGVFWKSPDPFVIFDPLTDLNAMHEVVKHINGLDWGRYANWLQCNSAGSGIRATAEQRAEAFLRAIGKWE